MSDDQDGCEWVSFFRYWPTRVVMDQRPLNSCVCVCACVRVCVRVWYYCIVLFILVQKLQYGIHLHEFFCVNVKLR